MSHSICFCLSQFCIHSFKSLTAPMCGKQTGCKRNFIIWSQWEFIQTFTIIFFRRSCHDKLSYCLVDFLLHSLELTLGCHLLVKKRPRSDANVRPQLSVELQKSQKSIMCSVFEVTWTKCSLTVNVSDIQICDIQVCDIQVTVCDIQVCDIEVPHICCHHERGT